MQAGQQNFQQGKMDAALKAFTSATALDPERVEGWINLGSALFELKHFGHAATALKKAIEMNPKQMISHLLFGDALRMLGRWTEAFASYKQAVALERTPLSLNKLACAMPSQGHLEFAEGLFEEAISLDPNFTMARVNLATLQILLNRFDDATAQLAEVSALPLSLMERKEVESAQRALSEQKRLNGALSQLATHNNPAPLEFALRELPDEIDRVDEAMIEILQRYAESARTIEIEPVELIPDLPADWPMIEAMFMVPMVSNVEEYRQLQREIELESEPSLQLRQSLNMVPAIEAARQ